MPQPPVEVDADFAELFFKFANTCTEESVLRRLHEGRGGAAASVYAGAGYIGLAGSIAIAGEDDYWQKLEELFDKTNEEIGKADPSIGDTASGWFGKAKAVLRREKTMADLLDKRSDEEKREAELNRLAERTEHFAERSDSGIESLAHSASMNVDMGILGMKSGDHSGALSSLLQHSKVRSLLEKNPALAAALAPGNENYQHDLFLSARASSLESHWDKRDTATGAHQEVNLEKLIATLERLIKSFNVVAVETPE